MSLGQQFNYVPGEVTLAPLAQLKCYYTHYFCGKPYGYYVDVGYQFRYFRPMDNRVGGQGASSRARHSIVQHGIDVSFAAKIRNVNYHRNSEWCILLGPKLHVPLGAQETFSEGDPLAVVPEIRYKIQPGLFLDFVWRFPVSGDRNANTCLFYVGTAAHALPEYTLNSQNQYYWATYIGIGYNFWRTS